MKKSFFYLLTVLLLFISCTNNAGGTDNSTEKEIEDTTPPSEVRNVTVEIGNQYVLLSWVNPDDADFHSTKIIFTPVEEEVNQPIIVEGNKSEISNKVITGLKNGIKYTFSLIALDETGNQSKSVSIQAVPETKLIASVYLPNDNENTLLLTNDEAPVNISFTKVEEIQKAVLKKGQYNIKPDINTLLDDSFTNNFTINNGVGTCIVAENGIYDIVVKNSNNDVDWTQIEIKTIDKTPISEVDNLNTSSDGEYVYITWKDPLPENKYDSPLKKLKISYIYNDDNYDIDNGEVIVNAGIESAAIKISEHNKGSGFMRITMKTIDELENLSNGKIITEYCYRYLTATAIDIEELLEGMTKSGVVVVTGELPKNKELLAIRNGLLYLIENKSEIQVDLDLSRTTGLSYIGSSMEKGFNGCSNLTSIILPDSLTRIQDNGFKNCTSLKSITIPATVTEIGDGLDSLANLNSVYFNGTIEQWCSIYIANEIFANKADLYIGYKKIAGNLEISDGITKIGDYSFCGCSSITNVEMPKSVTVIGEQAFSNCTNLETVILSDGVTDIQLGAFMGCSKLNSISLSNKLEIIGNCAFYGCEQLAEIIIPTSVKTIEGSAFSGCSNLTNILIDNSVTSIGDSAFAYCSKITSVKIPNTVTSINDCAFYGCESLSCVEIGIAVFEKGFNAVFEDCDNITKVIITDGVTNLSDLALSGCSTITEIELPNGLTTIGKKAFNGCSKLTSITIPASVTEIRESAFSLCSKLNNIIYKGNLGQWSEITFKDESSTPYCNNVNRTMLFNNQKLTDIQIPEGTERISSYAFYRTTLKTVTIPNTVNSIGENAFANTLLSEVTIPGSVINIGTGAFSNCALLNNVVLEVGVKNIENKVFQNSSELISVTLPSSITKIGEDVFTGAGIKEVFYNGSLAQWCQIQFECNSCGNGAKLYINGENLVNAVIPVGVTRINKYCFAGCNELESITIPSSITLIESDAFTNCYKLKNVYYQGTLEGWCSITFNDTPCSHGGELQKDCGAYLYIGGEKLTDAILPETITTLRKNIFYGCLSLESVTIPDSVTRIEKNAFADCYNLSSVKKMKNVVYIGEHAFSSTKSLNTINLPNTLTLIDSNAFYNDANVFVRTLSVLIPSSVSKIGKLAFYGNDLHIYFEDEDSNWYATPNSDYTGGILIGKMIDGEDENSNNTNIKYTFIEIDNVQHPYNNFYNYLYKGN